MSFSQALLYFLREASVNLLRSWKVSLLAVFTIAISLFVGGGFLLVSANLSQLLEGWRQQTEVVVYLEADAPEQALAAVADEAAEAAWVTGVERISRRQARERFQRLFPSLADLADSGGSAGGDGGALPASVEISFDPQLAVEEEFDRWIGQLQERRWVDMVDDDREWLEQLGTVLTVIRGLGLTLALVLLGAAIFTIASVVRLTAYLYADEIAVMRLVGATEFFIRGPFYAEGLLQGVIGGLTAALALLGGFEVARAQTGGSAWGQLLTESFLSPVQLAFLVGLGAAAGLFGAVASLRRESLDAAEATSEAAAGAE